MENVAEETFYYFGGFLRSGKRGYALVHEPSVLKICDVGLMVTFVFYEIGNGGRFREFLLKCINVGNTKAIYYEGLHAAPIIGLEESIKIFEPNVPIYGLSTLVVGIFNDCLGKDKEASKVFQQFEAYHHDLQFNEILEMEDDLEWRLWSIGVENENRYGATFKVPDDEVIPSPTPLWP